MDAASSTGNNSITRNNSTPQIVITASNMTGNTINVYNCPISPCTFSAPTVCSQSTTSSPATYHVVPWHAAPQQAGNRFRPHIASCTYTPASAHPGTFVTPTGRQSLFGINTSVIPAQAAEQSVRVRHLAEKEQPIKTVSLNSNKKLKKRYGLGGTFINSCIMKYGGANKITADLLIKEAISQGKLNKLSEQSEVNFLNNCKVAALSKNFNRERNKDKTSGDGEKLKHISARSLLDAAVANLTGFSEIPQAQLRSAGADQLVSVYSLLQGQDIPQPSSGKTDNMSTSSYTPGLLFAEVMQDKKQMHQWNDDYATEKQNKIDAHVNDAAIVIALAQKKGFLPAESTSFNEYLAIRRQIHGIYETLHATTRLSQIDLMKAAGKIKNFGSQYIELHGMKNTSSHTKTLVSSIKKRDFIAKCNARHSANRSQMNKKRRLIESYSDVIISELLLCQKTQKKMISNQIVSALQPCIDIILKFINHPEVTKEKLLDALEKKRDKRKDYIADPFATLEEKHRDLIDDLLKTENDRKKQITWEILDKASVKNGIHLKKLIDKFKDDNGEYSAFINETVDKLNKNKVINGYNDGNGDFFIYPVDNITANFYFSFSARMYPSKKPTIASQEG